MKKTLMLSVIAICLLLSFASCRKDYTCKCHVVTTTHDGYIVLESNTVNQVRTTTKDDAKSQCHYYEFETDYLQQKAVEHHYCEID
ncbi:MAG: hypothetical protein JST82_14865 [Bacteroidetes bacterium]|nr:hypothetical protein [Bacteroidota bacterium]